VSGRIVWFPSGRPVTYHCCSVTGEITPFLCSRHLLLSRNRATRSGGTGYRPTLPPAIVGRGTAACNELVHVAGTRSQHEQSSAHNSCRQKSSRNFRHRIPTLPIDISHMPTSRWNGLRFSHPRDQRSDREGAGDQYCPKEGSGRARRQAARSG
jgi:hypothetical protein